MCVAILLVRLVACSVVVAACEVSLPVVANKELVVCSGSLLVLKLVDKSGVAEVIFAAIINGVDAAHEMES